MLHLVETVTEAVIRFLWILLLLAVFLAVPVLLAFLLSGCDVKDEQDRAIERAAAAGLNLSADQCVRVEGGEGGDDLAICSDGRRLIICGGDDDCLLVNLDPERAPAEVAP